MEFQSWKKIFICFSLSTQNYPNLLMFSCSVVQKKLRLCIFCGEESGKVSYTD